MSKLRVCPYGVYHSESIAFQYTEYAPYCPLCIAVIKIGKLEAELLSARADLILGPNPKRLLGRAQLFQPNPSSPESKNREVYEIACELRYIGLDIRATDHRGNGVVYNAMRIIRIVEPK